MEGVSQRGRGESVRQEVRQSPRAEAKRQESDMVAEEDDNDDLLSLMDLAAKRNPDLEKEGFLLQEKVEGIEMSAGSYFNGFGWAQPVMCTFENKKLAPKPWPGPTTGEMGSHAFWSYEPKLFTQVTKKMTPFLQEMKYRGDFDINCIITKHGPLALEMTPRTGFPAVCLQMSNFKGDFGEFLYNVAAGEPLTFEPVDRWGVGVLMTCPPFPYDEVLHDPAAFADIPVYGKFTRDIYPLDVDMEDGAYYSSGTGWIAVACGTGPDLTAAKNAAYKRLKTLRVPNAFARSDIGDRFFEEKAELEKGGWLS
jgi:phosphoribosylamine--glycine ligase